MPQLSPRIMTQSRTLPLSSRPAMSSSLAADANSMSSRERGVKTAERGTDALHAPTGSQRNDRLLRAA